MNTELEELYFVREDRALVEGVGDTIKNALRDEGRVHVAGLLVGSESTLSPCCVPG